jgi:hypothetical protein
MSARTFTVKVALGIMTFAAPAAFAQAMSSGGMNPPGRGGSPGSGSPPMPSHPIADQRPDHRPDHGGNNGNNNFLYLPWVSGGFGPYYPADSGPQQASPQAPQIYDIAPAIGMAAYANTEYDNRWSSLQVLLDRSRKEFQISDQYLKAKKDVDDAQANYDAAVDTVLSKLGDDPNYKDLIIKRTEQQVALKSIPVDTGARDAVAEKKMQAGSQVTQMEAAALANDSNVQDSRTKLVNADESLRLLEKRFEADLYKRPDVVAGRQQVEVARANKAGADGYLYGAWISRADQAYANDQTYTGNTVYYSDPYYRGYYGLGVGSF